MLDGTIAGAAREHADLRDVEPPPSAARVLQREPRDEAHRRGSASRRIGRGEDLAVRALRAVDLVLSVQPGRLPRRGRAAGSRTFGVAAPQVARATPRRARAKRCSSRCSAARAAAASRGSSRRSYAGAARSTRGKDKRGESARERAHDRPRRRGGHRSAPTGRCCSRSVRRASRTPATGSSPAASSSPARSPRDALDRELAEELGIAVRRAAPWLVQRFRLSARARRAPLLPRVRVGRRARRPRRPGVRVADAGRVRRRAAAAGQHARPARAAAAAGLRHHAWPTISARTRFSRARERALDAGLEARAAARKDVAASSGSARSPTALVALARPHGAKVLLNGDVETRARARAAPACTGRRRARRRDVASATISCARRRATRAPSSRAPARSALDFAVLGPVLATPTHPGAPPLGWERLRGDRRRDARCRSSRSAALAPPISPTAIAHGAHGVALRRAAWPA